jgi:phosphoribosylaminoimidazole-succinocarboxamide synthase
MLRSNSVQVLAEVIGRKTKIIKPFPQHPHHVLIKATDNIFVGDGLRQAVLFGKAKFATTVTSNVFELLLGHEIPLAFKYKFCPETFVALRCQMIPLKVIVRFEAAGTFLERNPLLAAGDVLSPPVVEFSLKTSSHEVDAVGILCEEPSVRYDQQTDSWLLYHRDTGVRIASLGAVSGSLESTLNHHADCLEKIALQVGEILQVAWAKLDCRLQDVRMEFGIAPDGTVVLADVIDCDSWRLEWQGRQLSSYAYLQGSSLDDVFTRYEKATELSALLK